MTITHYKLVNQWFMLTTLFNLFFFQGCDPGWHVVNSSLFQYQAQVLAHADCLGAVFYFNGVHCF